MCLTSPRSSGCFPPVLSDNIPLCGKITSFCKYFPLMFICTIVHFYKTEKFWFQLCTKHKIYSTDVTKN
jgi:hypothetical protein